ncbi:TolC family outer membrane protein [Palleronia sp. LCG004]|uniref:TolC family outer membrane protein n=1 Tax=Palleronia sp. LCG004 TaxID=3079304 RepID=UPI002943DAF3|nr:TolC family outer membrane protein [Palleronia sp. LCG004]WOI55156.1 TolC family outer membrane protein [Palleronia sp. LCG004]
MRAAGRLLRASALALGTLAATASAQAETLGDALVLAYRHAGLLEKNRAVLRAADENVAQALSQLRPIVSYSANIRRTWTFPNDRTVPGQSANGMQITPDTRIGDDANTTSTIGISAELLLWDGGATRLGTDIARESVLATRQGLIGAEQQVLLNAVQAYLGVRESIAFVNLRESNVELISEQLRAARDRFEVGEVTRTDVSVAEAGLASARSGLAAALGDLEQARANYVRFVGQLPGALAEIRNLPPLPATLAAAQDVARKSHPDILRAMRLVTVSELNVSQAKASFRPSISGSANLNVADDFEESASVGVQMSGPIYTGGRLSSLYRQAIANRDESFADLHIATDNVLQQVAQAWALLEVARARIEAGGLEVSAARLAFESVQEEVRFGTRTTLDILDAEQDLQDARANLISAQISEINAAYQLLSGMGLMTVEHLDLPVVTYDPEAYYNAVRNAPLREVSPQGEKLDSILRAIGRN